MMARDDDVMIAYGRDEEISGLLGIAKTNELLSATHIGLRHVLNEEALLGIVAREVGRDLEHRDRPLLHETADANAYARLKMGVELIALNKAERYGAMGKDKLASGNIHTRWVSLEASDTSQRLANDHCKQGRHVALAASNNAF